MVSVLVTLVVLCECGYRQLQGP